MEKVTLGIKGMHCASCASIITGKLSRLAGIKHVDVNFATNQAQIEYEPDQVSLSQMNDEIGQLGYSLYDAGAMQDTTHQHANHADHTDHAAHLGIDLTKPEKLLALSQQLQKTQVAFPVALIVFLLMMWDIAGRVFPFLQPLPIPMPTQNVILLILATIIVFWVGQPFLLGVVRFARYHVANMDTLIGIGTLVAYIYSVVIVLFPSVRVALQLPETTYFDVVIVVIGFVTLGKYLEARSRLKTGEAIEKLLGLQAKTATVWRNNTEMDISIAEVVIGDVVIVKPGDKIPVDGKIIAGDTAVDESMITGESMPIDKTVGDMVVGSTINKQGHIKFTATRVGSDTMLAQIIKMVEEAQGSKAPIQALADKISGIFVPIVLAIALLSFATWLIVGSPTLGVSSALSYAILAFVGVLVIACPCALGLATPTAIIVGVGKGAEHGILIKNAEGLEKLSSINTIVFDKTGTITKGRPEVTDIVIVDTQFSENELLQLAASVEKLSEHPLAQAIAEYAVQKSLDLVPVDNFTALEGIGVQATINTQKIYIHKPDPSFSDPRIKLLQEQGKTVVIVEIEGKLAGLIALSDTLKDEAKAAIDRLHKKNVQVIMLTGDNHLAANYIAQQVNIDTVIAEIMPQDKANKIKELQAQGRKVAMAGDGVNDAPALAQADVGIAMATGTDVAIESAGITLLHGDIKKISQAIDLSRATMRTVKQNLFWAFIYNVVGIPIAAGLLYPLWKITLNPIFAGLAMAGSSVSVVSNSLRLKSLRLK